MVASLEGGGLRRVSVSFWKGEDLGKGEVGGTERAVPSSNVASNDGTIRKTGLSLGRDSWDE